MRMLISGRRLQPFTTARLLLQYPLKQPLIKNYKWTFTEENVWNVPNVITIGRIAMSPMIAAAIIEEYRLVAFVGCVISVFSDWLDGYFAKKFDQRTVLGSFLDPLADKIFIASLSLSLCYIQLLPLPLLGIYLTRDSLLIAGSFAMRSKERDPTAPFFDTSSSATFSISPTNFSKANSGLQFLMLSLTLGHFTFQFPSLELVEPLWWVTAVTAIGSGLEYLDGSGRKSIVQRPKTI